jgi:hypothetical protein
MGDHRGQSHESPGETGKADLEPAARSIEDPHCPCGEGEDDDPGDGERNHRRIERLLLGHVRMLSMRVLAGIVHIVVRAIQAIVSGLRWLARQAYRQRSLGVASNPQLTRLLDVHFVTVAAHLALVAALIVAAPPPNGFDLLVCVPLLVLLVAIVSWRSTRIVIALLVAAQLVICLVAMWMHEGILLALLIAFAAAQQTALVRSARAWLGRATAAGLLLGVITGGGGLLGGIFTPAFPLWICAILLTVALVLAVRMPAPPPHPKLPKQPKQPSGVPEGYAIYRPSSLDDPPRP